MIPILFATADSCGQKFLGVLPSWWEFLPNQPVPTSDPATNCAITLNFPNDFWLIGLAIINILLLIAGMVAVISVVIAGFEYVFSIGNSEKITAARKRIQNSLIGLAISLIAVALVSFMGHALG